ncbi:hypothetical protein [Isoptericola sp. NPDC055881]
MPTQTLPIPTDAGARDALLARVSALAELRHPCVEPVAAVDVRDDGTLAVRRGGAATDLPTVLAVRGRLTSREAAGVVVAVARGLAALHSAGLRQGGLDVGDVVLGPDGTALLRPRATVALDVTMTRADEDEAADVHALALLVAELLGDRDDDDAVGLRAVLAAASAPDPRVRPEAGTLAAQADRAVPPEPVRLPEAAALAGAALGRRPATRAAVQGSLPSRRRVVRGGRGAHGPQDARRGRGRGRGSVAPPPPRADAGGSRRGVRHGRVTRATRGRPAGHVLAAGGAVGLVALLAVVVLEVRSPSGGAVPAVAPAPATVAPAASGTTVERADPTGDPADPAAAAAELTRRRVELLSPGPGGDAVTGAATLHDVDVPGSPVHEADTELLTDAARSGTAVRGAEARVQAARTQRHQDGQADVVVRYVVGAHEQVAADGTVTAVPETERRTATLRLTWTSDGWRVADVA